MEASRQTMSVDLETMAQSRLRDALLATNLTDQSVEVGVKVFIHLGHVIRHDRRKQDSAETGRRVDRQDEIAERQTPRRRHRS